MNKSKFVILEGGLGNQLWQFAFAHKLSKIGPVVLLRLFEDANIEINKSADSVLQELCRVCPHDIRYEKRARSSIPARARFVPNSRYFKLNPFKKRFLDARRLMWKDLNGIDVLRSEIYLGYFQSVSYLSKEIPFVLEEFKKLLSVKVSSNSISVDKRGFVHIRGGDYFNLANHGIFGVLSNRFYSRLETMIPGKLASDYLIFTNDKEYVLQVIPDLDPSNVIGPNEMNEIETLSVMSNSKIACIANSTFSWWGGMLARENGAQIFAPLPWLKIEKLQNEFSSDLYLDNFRKIESSFL
jgi:hypothetical protein